VTAPNAPFRELVVQVDSELDRDRARVHARLREAYELGFAEGTLRARDLDRRDEQFERAVFEVSVMNFALILVGSLGFVAAMIFLFVR
jgi:hypothetical protein